MKPRSLNYSMFVFQIFFIYVIACLHGEERVLWRDGQGRIVWRYFDGMPSSLVWLDIKGNEEGLMPSEMHFGYEHAMRVGNRIALVGADTLGQIHYWCVEKKGDRWEMSHSADFGTRLSMPKGVNAFKIADIDKLIGINQGEPHLNIQVPIEITDIPLLPDVPGHPLRLVLVNGQIHKPKGAYFPGAVWDQSLEQIRMDHEARKSKSGTETKTSKQTSPEASSTRKRQEALPGPPNHSSSSSNWIAAAGVTLGLIVAALVWQRKKGAA